MSELQYTTVDRIFSKFHRDLRGTDINESDVVEWIGEALGFLRVAQVQEQAVAFMEVKNHHADIPKNFHMVLQIARNNNWEKTDKCAPCNIIKCIQTDNDIEDIEPCNDCSTDCEHVLTTDCNGFILLNGDIIEYKPYFDMKLNYQPWLNSQYYKKSFTPVRLANHTLFNTIVCKEKHDLYHSCEDEYTVVGTQEKKLRFSFSEGHVAMSYLKNAIDDTTGYPLVPDEISYITAITYYIKWKIAEWFQWNGRAGYDGITQDNERKWLKYAKQAKNYAKMPKSLDDYQDLLEQTHQLIPNHKKYYGFFGNLGKSQDVDFNFNMNISYGTRTQ